jgi:hypothetical protein
LIGPALTFETLISLAKENAGISDWPSRASLANSIVALSHFVEERGRRNDEPVGGLLRIGFRKALEAHMAGLAARHTDPRVMANRRSSLKGWVKAVAALDRLAAAQSGSLPPFSSLLKQLFAGCATPSGTTIPMKSVTKAVGIPYSTLRRWVAGGRPRGPRQMHYVEKMERFFGMSPGALRGTLPGRPSGTNGAVAEKSAKSKYRSRLSRLSKDPYILKPAKVLEPLRLQWQAVVEIKTNVWGASSAFSDHAMRSDERKVWSLHAPGSAPGSVNDWTHCIHGRASPTAEKAFQQIASYIGWLMLPESRGGATFSPESAQSLVHLVNVRLLRRYLEWMTSRSEGLIHGGQKSFLQTVGMLSHTTGPLRSMSLNLAIAEGISVEAWNMRCVEAAAWSVTARKSIRSQLTQSRDPFEPLKSVLDLRDPMGAVADAIGRMRANRPCTGGMKEAMWARDLLLFALMASNPIRARNLKELNYRPDGSGDLRQDPDGGWRVFIPRERLKNRNGAARDEDYSCRVQPQVWPLIEQYLKTYRPILAGPGVEYVFVNSRKCFGQWERMSRQVEALTRRYFVDCPGFCPHGFRHIVATAILKKSGSIIMAAKALHDRPATVEAEYGHLVHDDAAAFMEENFLEAFGRF